MKTKFKIKKIYICIVSIDQLVDETELDYLEHVYVLPYWYTRSDTHDAGSQSQNLVDHKRLEGS